MALVTRKASIYGVRLGVTGAAVMIGGIEQQNVKAEPDIRREAKSGETVARTVWLAGQSVGASFTSLDIKTILDNGAVTGLDIASLAHVSTPELDLFAYMHKKGGTREGASKHRKYHITEGIISFGSLTADHQGDAKLTVNAAAQWDGTNDPVTLADLETLPAAAADLVRFALGGVTIESVALPAVRSMTIDFGVKVVGEGNESDIWDSFFSIEEIAPVITIRGLDIEWLKAANIPLIGKAVTHANTTIYLRKRVQGGDFVANGTAEHIKITAAGSIFVEDAIDGSGSDGAECSLVMHCKNDGSNDPIIINTTSAIT